MWKAYFGNCAAKCAKPLSVDNKLRLLQRSVVPCFDFRNTRWPPHQQLGCEIDRLQRKMAAGIVSIPRFPGESAEAYVRRRNRTVSSRCKRIGIANVF